MKLTKRQKQGKRQLAEADSLDRHIGKLERVFQRQQEARLERHRAHIEKLYRKLERLTAQGNANLSNQTLAEYLG